MIILIVIGTFSLLACMCTHTHAHTHTHTCTHTHTQIIALIALALVAGFTVEPYIHCQVRQAEIDYDFTAKYPFDHYRLKNDSNTSRGSNSSNVNFASGISQAAEFFVTWGSFTLIYAVVAILVYMFVTGIERLERIVDILVWFVSLSKNHLGMHI